jgi:hypothetical protein
MIELINKKENLYGDGIARIEQYDFSKANTSPYRLSWNDNRIKEGE